MNKKTKKTKQVTQEYYAIMGWSNKELASDLYETVAELEKTLDEDWDYIFKDMAVVKIIKTDLKLVQSGWKIL